MKKILLWASLLLFAGSLEYADYRAAREIFNLRQENRVLMTNNVNLINLNRALSEGVGTVTDKLIEKADWDKKVAEKIRQLDADVKELYGRTNKTIPSAVQ